MIDFNNRSPEWPLLITNACLIRITTSILPILFAMSAISEGFAQRLNASPDDTYSVMITLHPDAAIKPDTTLKSTNIEPVEGLQGIYKASLSGHEILKLQHNDNIQAIESDDLNFHALT
ncbi:MAG: hypothetical protein JWP57_2407 [Spirosoma sp.]|nr:hypothetical protein [Spirosoma sp.]